METALPVKAAIDRAAAMLPPDDPPPPAKAPPENPDVMVIGGTGYIGRALVRALVAGGHRVRVLSRGQAHPFADIADRVETRAVSLSDESALTAAMRGMACVFNLARSLEKTWEAALESDIGVTLAIGRSAAAAGVGRLVHTGTIASYDMSRPGDVITETTSFGDLAQRNLYARAKAEGEARLRALCAERGVSLVIGRPGIVVGGDGPLQHWGIGRWHGAGAVRLWGNGRNILPFVLIDDVAEGLIRMMEVPEAAGRSFNLTGAPLLTGRDYFDAIATRAGARIAVKTGNLTGMWLVDAVKYGLKRYAMGRKGALRASRADWLSRGHLARFDNALPRQILGWQPEVDRERFLERAIAPLALFGV